MARLGRTDPITDALRVATLIGADVGSVSLSNNAANPSASLALTAVNGTAATWMRSDAAPALDQSIAPSWTGLHIHRSGVRLDDGVSDSPLLSLVGGTNNDTAALWLADSATAGYSNVVLQLCDTGGESVLQIQDSGATAVLELDSNGNVELQADGTWVGRGAAAPRMVFESGDNELGLYNATDLRLYTDAGTSSVGWWSGTTGNLTLDDGSGDSPALQFIGGSNDDLAKLYLYNAAIAGYSDLVIRLCDAGGKSALFIHDSNDSLVFRVDSNGNAWIDDGSGDSPSLNFMGGTNDDTIKFYLDDDGTTGGSDLNLVLADSAGASNFEIWDSSSAAVLKFDSDGNIEMVTDGSWIGQPAGVQLTFDNTNDYLEITGGNVGIGTSAPVRPFMVVGAASSAAHTALFIDDTDKIGIGLGSIIISGTSTPSIQSTDHDGATYPDLIMQYSGGGIGIGPMATASAKLHVDQSSSTAAKPVVFLDQGDFDQAVWRIKSTAAAADLTRALVDKNDESSFTARAWIKVYIEDDGSQIAENNLHILAYEIS